MPLTRGRYPATNSWWKALGFQTQVAQTDLAPRSNAEWFGLAGLTDGALAATGVGCAVAIPVEVGDVISKISIFAGATAESGGSHAFAALYSGIDVPALLGQSTDETGSAAVAASTRHDFTLTAAQVITQAIAPNGYVYASISMTGTVATAAAWSTPAATGYQWFSTAPKSPLFLSASHGSALAGTAAATIASPSAKAVAPFVVLS